MRSMLVLALITGCTTISPEGSGQRPELFAGGKSDDGSAVATEDARPISCQLVYQSPRYEFRTAASLDATYGQVGAGVSARDDQYTFYLIRDPRPAAMPLNVVLYAPDGTLQAFTFAQDPAVDNDYFATLMAKIPPRTFDGVTYDSLRADCYIRAL